MKLFSRNFSFLFVFIAFLGGLGSFGPALALTLPAGELLLAEFRVSNGGESVSLAEWNWAEPWLSPNLDKNIFALSQVNEVVDKDAEKDSPNFDSEVLETAGFASANISPDTFIASSKIEGYASDVKVLYSEFRMFNVFEASPSPDEIEYAFSFLYSWLFKDSGDGMSEVEIAAEVSIESLFDPLDSFSFGISNLRGKDDKNFSSGQVSSRFSLSPGVPYVFSVWGATQWSGNGILDPLPLPETPDLNLPEENVPVPEPGAFFLLFLGFMVFVLWSSRSTGKVN
ncbi:MAG: hypothetical protein ACLFRG_01355 [Desulfococcaceae bacterium]